MDSNEWLNVTLRDVSKSIAYGYTASAQLEPIGPKFLRITDIVGEFDWNTVPYCEITPNDYKKYKLEIGDIVIARTGATTGTAEIIKEDKQAVFASYLIRFRIDKTIADPFFIGHILKSYSWKEYIKSSIGGSAQPGINANVLSQYDLLLPPLPIQHHIAEILSALDDKIELNRQTNATLEAIAQAIFKEWFVDFNFPGANGEMVESELGLIPKGWRVGKLEEIVTNFDRKRVPLSSRERENRKGAFPYYGAASILDYVDDYIFDGVYLLMGEDGTVITEDGKPVLQYVSGKFWVNNHTHVLQGKKPFSTEYVLLQLKNTNVKHIVTGAVQPKINQGNMNELPVVIPDEFTLLSFQDIITPIFSNVLDTEQETSILTGIRDNLLPKLMNGEIEV